MKRDHFLSFSPYQYRFITGMALVVSFRILGLSLILPVISHYGQSLTDSTLLLAVAVGGYGATQALFQIPYGIASDRFGRKRLILLGMIIFSLGSLAGWYATSIEMLVLARILQGGGAVTATVFAFISDVIESERRNIVTAFIGAPIGIFFSAGIVTGPIIAHAYGVHSLFLIGGLLGLVATAYVALFVEEERFSGTRDLISRELIGRVVRDGQLLRIDIAGLLMFSSLNAIFFLLPLIMAERFGLEVRQYVLVYIPMILGAVFFMILFSRLADKGFTRGSILVSFTLLTVGPLAMIYAGDHLRYFIAAAVLTYAGTNILEPILPVFVGKTAPRNGVGTAMGVYSTFQFAGSFVGAMLVGFLLPYGLSTAILSVSFMGITGLVLSYALKNPVAES